MRADGLPGRVAQLVHGRRLADAVPAHSQGLQQSGARQAREDIRDRLRCQTGPRRQRGAIDGLLLSYHPEDQGVATPGDPVGAAACCHGASLHYAMTLLYYPVIAVGQQPALISRHAPLSVTRRALS
jgi:hypothetical protein